jgi:hypothetical protein
MSCPVLLSPACLAVKAVAAPVAGAAASGALNGIASAIQSGIAWVVTQTVTWWVSVPSPDLAGEPAVGHLQQWLFPVTAAVAVAGMIIAGIRMALTRKANPLVDIGSGLVTIAATSAVGVLLPSLLIKAGDAWSTWVLQQSTGGQFASRLTAVLTLGGAAPAVVVVLGILAIVISALQAVLMLLRQGALVILAGMLPLAAAGSLNPATRPWLRRVSAWMLALIFYKPAAAAVYATAFTLIGQGSGTRTILMGFAMLLLSLLALPALMRFFTWGTGAIAENSGGGVLQTALGGAAAIGALRSPGGSGRSGAAEQARHVSSQLGPAGSGPSGAQPGSSHARQAAGPAAPGTAPAAGTGAAAGRAAGSPAAGTAGAGAAAGGGAASGLAAAGGPAGAAAAGLAAGASSARRKATDTMHLPDGAAQ